MRTLAVMTNAIPYRTAAVRDLAWSLQSPPLLCRRDAGVRWPESAWYKNAYREFAPVLQQLDSRPEPLLNFLDGRKDRRLGNYFETLLRYWLVESTRYSLLYANLPLRDKEKTLGEFDFIVRDEVSGKTLHWEVAVKFYLGVGDTTQACNWWGPARRDRLDLKTTHLLNHQSRLSTLPQAQALFAEAGTSIDATWLIMKGRLFYPHTTGSPSPVGADPGHLRGLWLAADQLAALPEGDWVILEKSQWLAPLLPAAGTPLKRQRLIEWWRDNSQTQPRCIAAIGEQGETGRVFVVPDGWGQEALPL